MQDQKPGLTDGTAYAISHQVTAYLHAKGTGRWCLRCFKEWQLECGGQKKGAPCLYWLNNYEKILGGCAGVTRTPVLDKTH